MKTIKIPVVDADVESYTPGTFPVRKASTAAPVILRSAIRHPVLSAGFHFAHGNFGAPAYIAIEATIQWGSRESDTQSRAMLLVDAPDEYERFCAEAIPQLLTLWAEMSDIPVKGAPADAKPGAVIWEVQ